MRQPAHLAVTALVTAVASVGANAGLAQSASEGFGGPSSVGQTLATLPREPFAERLHFGFDYSAMAQSAKADGTTNAAGGVARLYGTADLYGGEGTAAGTLTFKIENRHRLGTDIAPQDLGFAVGYVGLPAITFSDAGWLLTNLFWQHNSADNRWAVVAGITDVTDYVDVYALGNPWAEFSNLAFSTNPSIAAPNQGFGAAGRYRIGPNGYVLAGLADADADPSDPFQSLSDFAHDPQVFAHAEFGWVGSWEDRFTDNFHFTLWRSDRSNDAAVSSGNGASFSASWRVAERYIPFARLGYSDGGGALLERSASFGLGYDTGRGEDRAALGVNWGRPNQEDFGPTDGDQLTTEAYWRIGAADWFEVTPDLQYVHNPALAPEQDALWIFGLRLRAIF